MSRLTSVFAASGAAALLVAASFAAGVSSSLGPAAPLPAAAAAAPAPDGPDSDADRPAEGPGTLAVVATPEMQFVSIAPCRVVDTRAAGGPFGNGTSRSYYVGGTFGFAAQGGNSGGCGIPTGAKAISATILSLNPSGPGRIKGWRAGEVEPDANVQYHGATTLGTGATLPLRSGAGTDLSIKNFGATTDFVLDVNGYYVPQMAAYIGSGGTVIDQSGRLISSTKTGQGEYTLVWDRDVSTCVGVASSDITGHIMSVYTSGTASYIYIDDNAGIAADYWVNVTIVC